MTISKMTQRSNRLDARIDRLIEAQERFVAALTEALAQFVQPAHMVSASYHSTAGATLHHRDVTAAPYPLSAQPEDTERRVPRMTQAISDSLTQSANEAWEKIRAKVFQDAIDALPNDIDPRALETIEIELPDGVALQSAAHPGSERMSDEDLLDQGYDPDAFADMAAELAGDIEEDEPLPPQDDEGVWRKRLHLNALRLWQPDWGPRPGQAGCLVPAHLLNGRG